jgi:hypothetical protein
MCKGFGADMMYTEFISSDGLIRDAAKSLAKLRIDPAERPIGVQIYGHLMEPMVEAARMAADARPDALGKARGLHHGLHQVTVNLHPHRPLGVLYLHFGERFGGLVHQSVRRNELGVNHVRAEIFAHPAERPVGYVFHRREQ